MSELVLQKKVIVWLICDSNSGFSKPARFKLIIFYNYLARIIVLMRLIWLMNLYFKKVFYYFTRNMFCGMWCLPHIQIHN